MRLEQLHYFEVLSQEGSFNKAAAKLHVAQPSLTASIKSMEKELDKTLFTRDARGITLTDDGKRVLTFSQEVIKLYRALYRALHQDLYGTPEQPKGTVSIVAPKFFTQVILEQFQRNFAEKYAQVNLRVIENDYHSTAQHLSSTSCKFAITSNLASEDEAKCAPGMLVPDEEFFDSQYQYLPLFQDVFGFCLAKNNPLSTFTPICPITLAEGRYPLTLFPFGQVIITDHVLLSSANVNLHIDAMIKENAYCNIPYFAYQKLFAADDRLTFRAYSNNMTITYYLIYPADHTLTSAEQIFIDELQNYLTQMKFK